MKQVILGDESFLEAEGLKPEPERWENGRRTEDRADAFEWWYFDAQLDDGSTVVVAFSVKDPVARKGKASPTVRVTITPPDGKRPIERFKIFKAQDLRAEKDWCSVTIGGVNSVQSDQADQTYTVHAEVKGTVVDLTFVRRLPAWRPDTGKMFFDTDCTQYFAWLAAMPLAEVHGTLTYGRGKTPLSVRGAGYHDHNWGNVDLYKVLSYWYWGRAHLGTSTTIFVEMVATKAFGRVRVPIVMFAQNGAIESGKITLLPPDQGAGLPAPVRACERWRYPKQIDAMWQTDEGTVTVRLKGPRVINSTRFKALIAKMRMIPLWRRLIMWMFATGHYYRFRADGAIRADLRNGPHPISSEERGEVLYELCILR